MNLEIFKQPDPAGKFSKEKYLIKNYPEEYDYIINFSIKNKIIDTPFKEKVYLCINDIKYIPTCKNPNCDNKVNYKNSTIGYYEYCCNKCISSDTNIKKIKEEKSIEKFGTKSPAQSKIIKDKIIETNNKKYGGNSPMSNLKIQEKSKNTLLKNYGVTCPSHNKNILYKRIENFKKSDYKITFAKTNMEKYGVTHPWKLTEIHHKTKISHFKDNIINKINTNYKFITCEFLKNGNPSNIILYCEKCYENFNITNWQFHSRIENTPNQLCTNCYPIADNSSLMQIDLLNFIKDNYNGIILENSKNIINPYEIDIFLPELNLGIEFNGLHWHSDRYKNNDYHLKKWQKSIDNNINLITIWEDDWITKKDICKSFLLNKLNKTPNKIFARKCLIKEVSYNDSKVFLESNHLQGNSISSTRVGLYYNNELISLMTFGKLRLPLSGINTENEYELIRFANKINTNCVGGASRLLSSFIKNYKPKTMISYSDNLISNGNLYKKLGFEYSHTSNPGYWYIINEIREHRFNWRKSKLVSMGYDKNKTEFEIMLENGYNKIFNAGNKKWILKLS